MIFELPEEIANLVKARNELRARFAASGLKFTFDGNLVGDLAEALAAEHFGLNLTSKRGTEGIDATAPDGRTVQVKATATRRSAVFRRVPTHADHLLFFCFDTEQLKASLLFNGPEKLVRQLLPEVWRGQRSVSRKRIIELNSSVPDDLRLVPIS